VTGVGTFEWNIQTGASQWTPEMEAMYGLPPGGFGGTHQSWVNLIYPEDRPEAARRVQAAIETGTFEAEWRVAWPDGTLHWLFGRALLFNDESGKPIRLIGVSIDITERKRAEERFRLAVEAAPNGMVIVNREGRIVLANSQTEKMFGYRREELIGQKVEMLAPALLRLSHGALRTAFFSRPEARPMGAGRELYACRKDGTQFAVEIGLNPIETAEGTWVLSSIVDITERKRAEEAIHRLNAELEKRVRERTAELEAANKELEAFAYSVSHDLRAPLRGIDGWSLALAEDYGERLDERAQQYLDKVRSETQHMGLLIDDLLQLSRVSRTEMQREPVDLTSLARHIAAGLREGCPERQIEFVIEPGLRASGDARLLEVVLTNLLGNAIKFTSPRAEARIQFGRSGGDGTPVYYVRDNGVGFDMAYASTLFGAFQRLHKSSEFPGTGIGLATVQRIIHRHGGRVWADAQAGRGATFYFTIEAKQ
jgi:PAS domain S-box-containing protein